MLSIICNKLYTPCCCCIKQSNALKIIYDELYLYPIDTGLPKDLNDIIINYVRHDYNISIENERGIYVKLTLPKYKLEIQLREYNKRYDSYLETGNVNWTIIFKSNQIIMKDLDDPLNLLDKFIEISIEYTKKSEYWKLNGINGINYYKYLDEMYPFLKE